MATKTINTSVEITQLQEKLKALQEKQAQETREYYEGLGKKIDMLPGTLGLKDLDEVRSMISAHQRNSLAALAKSGGKRVNKRLTDAEKAKIDEMLRADKTATEIVAQIGCSVPTVQARKKALGLVKARTATAKV